MIDTIYQIILTLLNKENAGYLNPTEFNLLAIKVQNQILREYFGDLARDQDRMNRGRLGTGLSNLPFLQRQKIYAFSSIENLTQAAGEYTLPDDLYFLEHDGLAVAGTGRVVEEVEKGKLNYLLNSKAISDIAPVYERFESGGVITIRVYPTTITEDITCRYIRNPLNPNWTFFGVGADGNPLFDPSNPSFQDFELQENELSNIVIRMAYSFGINIRDIEVAQLMEQVENKNYVKDNQ